MKFAIRFKIRNRLGASSKYSLRDFCVSIVDRYSLSEKEVELIVKLPLGQSFDNPDLLITRVE